MRSSGPAFLPMEDSAHRNGPVISRTFPIKMPAGNELRTCPAHLQWPPGLPNFRYSPIAFVTNRPSAGRAEPGGPSQPETSHRPDNPARACTWGRFHQKGARLLSVSQAANWDDLDVHGSD